MRNRRCARSWLPIIRLPAAKNCGCASASSYPLALGDATLAGRALIEQVLARASFELDPRLVSNSVEAMKAFVHINRGICFQFRKPGKASVPPGDMIAVPLVDAPLLQAKLYLATRRGRVLPVAAAAFVELLRTELE